MPEDRKWIEDVELEDVKVKWAFSHFDGRADTFNDEGDHNFTIILPEETAMQLREEGWNVKAREPLEEGDPMEYTLQVKISYKYDAPRIFLIKNDRKVRAEQADLAEIRRDSTEQIDVVITPSRWVNGARSGITAYTKELYAKVRPSRFEEKYADYESV